MLVGMKRIVIKDSSINAICYGAKLMIPGILRFDNDINIDEEVVIMSTKGEAVAIAIARMTTAEISSCDHGTVCKTKRVVMDRETYPRKWKEGPRAKRKQMLIKEGKLEKNGKPNGNTPQDYLLYYNNEVDNNLVK